MRIVHSLIRRFRERIARRDHRCEDAVAFDILEARMLLSGTVMPLALGDRTISVGDAGIFEGDSGTRQMVFTVSISGIATVPISVTVATADGTAKAGTDYQSTNTTVVFSPGQTEAEFIVPIIGDTAIEDNETFLVNLSNPVTGTIDRGQGIGTIVDDDKPVVSVAARDANASEMGLDPGVFRISRTGSTAAALTVSYSAKGTATSAADYRKIKASATIPAGKKFVDVTISPLHDTLAEGDETVVLKLKSNVAYGIGSPNSATVTITDGEIVPPTAQLKSAPTLSAPTVQNYQFTVRYTDNDQLDLASIGNGDLRITGPNGYNQPAALVSMKITKTHNAANVVYSISAPGGSWEATDNGTYTISVVAKAVKDRTGNAVTAGGLGTFEVQI